MAALTKLCLNSSSYKLCIYTFPKAASSSCGHFSASQGCPLTGASTVLQSVEFKRGKCNGNNNGLGYLLREFANAVMNCLTPCSFPASRNIDRYFPTVLFSLTKRDQLVIDQSTWNHHSQCNTVDSRYLKLGYLENPAISNSNPFPLPLFFSHLLSAISNYSLSRTVFRSPWVFEIAGVYCISVLLVVNPFTPKSAKFKTE